MIPLLIVLMALPLGRVPGTPASSWGGGAWASGELPTEEKQRSSPGLLVGTLLGTGRPEVQAQQQQSGGGVGGFGEGVPCPSPPAPSPTPPA